MADSIQIPSGAGATAASTATIGAMQAGRQVNKAVMERILGSIEQAGQASASMQTAPNRVDRVQISQAAQQRLAAEQAQAG
jgi:hypothetical protein